MNYYLKIEILSGWGGMGAEARLLEIYNGATRILPTSLSIVSSSASWPTSSWAIANLLTGNGNGADFKDASYPYYAIIKSTQKFDNVKLYNDAQGGYAWKNVKWYTYASDTDPVRNGLKWRLVVEASYPSGLSTQSHRVATNKFLLKSPNGHYWSHATGDWVDLGIPSDQSSLVSLFQSQAEYSCPSYSAITQLEANTKICMWTDNSNLLSASVRCQEISFPKLILSNNDINLSTIESINFANIIVSQSGGGKVGTIVSIDKGKSWRTWINGSGWVDIDIDDPMNVFVNAMTSAAVSIRSKDDWFALIGDSKTIRFGYCVEIAASTDVANTEVLKLNVDTRGAWWDAINGADYRSNYPTSGSISVHLLATGDYKINY